MVINQAYLNLPTFHSVARYVFQLHRALPDLFGLSDCLILVGLLQNIECLLSSGLDPR